MLTGTAAEIGHAYNILASRRTMGMVPNPISLNEILAFVQIFGPPTVSISMFVDLIGIVDLAYLGLVSGNEHPS